MLTTKNIYTAKMVHRYTTVQQLTEIIIQASAVHALMPVRKLEVDEDTTIESIKLTSPIYPFFYRGINQPIGMLEP